MLEQWTRAILRARLVVLCAWGVVLVAGIVASTRLPSLLTNSFAVPGTSSDRAGKLLAVHFGERPEGTFLVVFPVRHPSDPALRRRLFRRLEAAARAVPGGSALPLQLGGGQADAVVEAIANQAGAAITPQPFHPVLRGLLLTGTAPRYLRNELRGGLGDTSTVATDILWWPPAKIVGHYLAPYLADAVDLDLTQPAAQVGDLTVTVDLGGEMA